MHEYDVVIVGAGVCGLSLGIEMARGGAKTAIFEHHSVPGGLAAMWKRGDFWFDGCIHWLMGANPDDPVHEIWDHLGVTPDVPMILPDPFSSVRDAEGLSFDWHCDRARLEAELRAKFPAERETLDDFFRMLDDVAGFDLSSWASTKKRGWLSQALAGLRMLCMMPKLMKYGNMTIGDFLARFKDPQARRAFSALWPVENMTFFFYLLIMRSIVTKGNGFPVGGSLAVARALERTFQKQGGQVFYRQGVKRILTEGDRALGVELEDGRAVRAKAVVAACDAYQTFERLLEGKRWTDEWRKRFAEKPMFGTMCTLSLGLKEPPTREAPDYQMVAYFPKTDPKPLFLRGFGPATGLVPAGKYALSIEVEAHYDHWAKLAQDRPRYLDEKQRTADRILSQLEPLMPGLRDKVVVQDLATPHTFEHYTRNYRGSIEGWIPSAFCDMQPLPIALPGLRNAYLVSQWTQPGGGIPGVAVHAIKSAPRILRAL